jgi:hypothetical protein
LCHIGSNAGIVLMNDAKDSGLLQACGQRLDSVLFSPCSDASGFFFDFGADSGTAAGRAVSNQIIGILLQACRQCQAHLQHHSRHISHALHEYEVNHGQFLISLTLFKLRRQGMVKIDLH